MNVKEQSELFYYSQANSNITFTKETKDGKTNVKLNFYPIEENDVCYYIKEVYNKSKIKDEKMDMIANSESIGRIMQINNPKYEKGKVISFNLENVKESVSYIKVMAKINSKELKIFLLYNPVLVSDDEPIDPCKSDTNNDNNKDNNEAVFAAIIVLSL